MPALCPRRPWVYIKHDKIQRGLGKGLGSLGGWPGGFGGRLTVAGGRWCVVYLRLIKGVRGVKSETIWPSPNGPFVSIGQPPLVLNFFHFCLPPLLEVFGRVWGRSKHYQQLTLPAQGPRPTPPLSISAGCGTTTPLLFFG